MFHRRPLRRPAPAPACRPLACVAAILLVASAGQASGQEFPSRPVTIIVPMSAGGQADILGRTLAEQMGRTLQQSVVVLNRDGAAGTVGVGAVKNAPPDGHTIGFGSQGPFSVQPQLRKSLPYSLEDFEFICQTNTLVLVLATSPKSPFTSLKELVDAARKAPGTVTMGSIGVGSGPHLIGEGIASEAGVKFNHIPFRSIGDLNTQLIAGGIDATVTTPALLASQKTVRALAVSGDHRLPSHPEVPLLKELGYRRGAVPGFLGVYAPKGIPPAALARLRQACSVAVQSEAFVTASERLNSPAQHADGGAYAQSVREDRKTMGDLIQALGIQPE
jgi:tripartite-type tricarboxylate transporter receptor subunit TctC